MDDDLLELTAITNLLLFLQEVQLARQFAFEEDGQQQLASFREAIAERISARARPEPGSQLDDRSLEIQSRMLARWHHLAANVERRRAELRTRLTGGQE